jgi:hypothetical protein
LLPDTEAAAMFQKVTERQDIVGVKWILAHRVFGVAVSLTGIAPTVGSSGEYLHFRVQFFFWHFVFDSDGVSTDSC